MLLKNGNSVRRLALSCAIACGFAVSFSAWATVPALPVASSSSGMSVAQSRAELLAALPKSVVPYYLSTLAPLYAANQMQPMWQDREAVQQFQQQLAELAISGVQPQFTQWVKLLTDPLITDMARDIVLSDAMLGYLQFVSSIGGQRQQLAVQQCTLQAEGASEYGDSTSGSSRYIRAKRWRILIRWPRSTLSTPKCIWRWREMLAAGRPWPQMTNGARPASRSAQRRYSRTARYSGAYRNANRHSGGSICFA
ncbi:murein L,D-transpeptidase [Serratia fonticola]|uniref:Murein L,D-transpeptidase n=1 Tax=Serratia fonticola TaxID=47917 RepID=A0A4V6Z2P4_SERFO|nr:murein L,D-transpeptidase [Serratia fonticola]